MKVSGGKRNFLRYLLETLLSPLKIPLAASIDQRKNKPFKKREKKDQAILHHSHNAKESVS